MSCQVKYKIQATFVVTWIRYIKCGKNKRSLLKSMHFPIFFSAFIPEKTWKQSGVQLWCDVCPTANTRSKVPDLIHDISVTNDEVKSSYSGCLTCHYYKYIAK